MDCGEGKGNVFVFKSCLAKGTGGLNHRCAHAYIWVLTKTIRFVRTGEKIDGLW